MRTITDLSQTDGSLGWDDIVAQIEQERPFALTINWPSGSLAHIVAGTGCRYAGDPAIAYLYIQDPALGPSWNLLQTLYDGRYNGDGTWTATTLSKP